MTALYPFQANHYEKNATFTDVLSNFLLIYSKIHSKSIKNSNQEAELSIFLKKEVTLVFLSLPIPFRIAIVTRDDTLEACSAATQKSNFSRCAVYQQCLSKMMHFYTNL